MMPGAKDGVATFRFTGAGLRGRKTYAIWRELVGRTILSLDMETLPDCQHHCEASTWFLPGFHKSRLIVSGVRAARTRSVLADGNDDITLHISNSGSLIASHGPRETLISQGQAIPMWNATVCAVAWQRPGRVTTLQVSRTLLTAMVPDLEDKLVRPSPVQAGDEALRLLNGYLDMLTSGQASREGGLRRLAATHVRDLVAVVLGASGDGTAQAEDGGVRAARLHAIKTDITQHLDRDDLSVAAVAPRHGVSSRYVQTLFEREGTTFSEYVLRQRLGRAHRLLADPDGIHRRIAEIAFEVGFGDLSYFNKSFRRQYGVTPSDVRATALSGTMRRRWA